MNVFDVLLPDDPPEMPSWRWAVVTQLAPAQIRFDGEDTDHPAAPSFLCDVSVGDRVYVQIYQRAAVVIGRAHPGQ